MERQSKYPWLCRRDRLERALTPGQSLADVARLLGTSEGKISN